MDYNKNRGDDKYYDSAFEEVMTMSKNGLLEKYIESLEELEDVEPSEELDRRVYAIIDRHYRKLRLRRAIVGFALFFFIAGRLLFINQPIVNVSARTVTIMTALRIDYPTYSIYNFDVAESIELPNTITYPDYIPDGYYLVDINISSHEDKYRAEFLTADGKAMEITQSGIDDSADFSGLESFETESATVYCSSADDTYSYNWRVMEHDFCIDTVINDIDVITKMIDSFR